MVTSIFNPLQRLLLPIRRFNCRFYDRVARGMTSQSTLTHRESSEHSRATVSCCYCVYKQFMALLLGTNTKHWLVISNTELPLLLACDTSPAYPLTPLDPRSHFAGVQVWRGERHGRCFILASLSCVVSWVLVTFNLSRERQENS